MEELRIERLEPAQHGALQRFYRAQRSAIRVKDAGQVWVVRDTQICGGLCLRPVAEGHWLTGLLVATGKRRGGIASRLLKDVRENVGGPLWLFCEPALGYFYRSRGFRDCHQLPPALASRLLRLTRNKTLLALCNAGQAPC